MMLSDRVAVAARERRPIEVRKGLLELCARAVYVPAWALGRLATGAVAALRFAAAAAGLGWTDGYRPKPRA